MIEPTSLKKECSHGVLLVTAMVMIASQGFFSHSVSAQGLLNRLRARIEARMAVPPPPPGPFAPAYGYRPPAAGPADAPPWQRPRVLATPTPQQGSAPGQYQHGRAGQIGEPTFGVEIAPVGFGPNRGLEVRGFRPDSPLLESGVRRGDVIVSLDGKRTDSMAAILAARRQISQGETPSMQIVRGGQLYQVRLPPWPIDDAAVDRSGTIASADASGRDPGPHSGAVPGSHAASRSGTDSRWSAKPPLDHPPVMRSPVEQSGYQISSPDRPRHDDLSGPPTSTGPTGRRASLGISARDASPQRGVIVVDVTAGSAGKVGGIEVNDRIVSAAGRLIRDTSGLVRELALSQPGDSVNLGVIRGDVMHELVVEMGRADGKPVQDAADVAKSAVPTPATPAERAASGDASSSENNLLSGLGSALGHFFGGASSPQSDLPKSSDPSEAKSEQQDTKDTSKAEANTDAEAEVFELPAPSAEPDPEPADPLALPEDD